MVARVLVNDRTREVAGYGVSLETDVDELTALGFERDVVEQRAVVVTLVVKDGIVVFENFERLVFSPIADSFHGVAKKPRAADKCFRRIERGLKSGKSKRAVKLR